ncbi:DUF2637 domain-containing protein [Streptomyces sp. NPDC002676]
MKRNPTRALAIAAGLVIVALTAAAFWLSYAHLAEVARRHGLSGAPVRAWAWPATLDLFIVAGELLMLRAAVGRRGVDWWAVGLTVAGSGGSIALNVAGVGSHADPLNYVVAAVPPTAALLAFGALMKQIHQALTDHTEPNFVDVVHEVPVAEVDVEQLPEPVETPRPLPEVVPAGARLLPIVARPQLVEATTEVTKPQYRLDHFAERYVPVEDAPKVVTPSPSFTSTWDVYKAVDLPKKMTAAVAAEQPREVVTEVITLSPAELRRKARSLNKEAVKSTGRSVTIKALQDGLGLSRRDAADLRREVVMAALVTGEAQS